MTKPDIPSADLRRYGDTIMAMADAAMACDDMRPGTEEKMNMCFAAAAEIMARDNDREVVLANMARAFTAFLAGMHEGANQIRERDAVRAVMRQPRDPLAIGHDAKAG